MIILTSALSTPRQLRTVEVACLSSTLEKKHAFTHPTCMAAERSQSKGLSSFCCWRCLVKAAGHSSAPERRACLQAHLGPSARARAKVDHGVASMRAILHARKGLIEQKRVDRRQERLKGRCGN
eukprot:2884031-Pleurochrysis_carterae.AAC.4